MRNTKSSVFGLVLVAVTACGRSGTEAPSGAAPGGGAQAPEAAANGRFVGKDACRPCHAEIWSTFSRTGMGRSWYPMSTAPIVEDWTTRNAIKVPSTGLCYRMSRRGGKFFVRQSIDDGRGGETAVDERELVWVVGSANHSRTYLISEGGKLFQAPVCWQTQDPVWDLCPGYERDNRYFARDIGRNCVFCHNDRMELLPGASNAYKEPLPDGIGCERCHGPGERHVAKWDHGATPTGQGDPTIVNPRRLSPGLRMQVCFPCHLGDANFTERVSLYQASLEDWRPGRPITTAVIPFRYSEATLHDFGLSGQVDRLLLSRCFRESGGRLECLTCHNPHKTIFREDRPADFFTTKCLGCHAREACTAGAAARRATTPPDNCVVCHMRTAEPDDQHHVRFTDHWIRTRIDDPPVARKRFDVEPYFPALLATLSPADRAFYTARAISLRAHVAPAEARPGMYPQAEAKFREAIGAGFARAEAPYFLGITLSAMGKRDEAADAFAAAFAKDPGDLDIAFAHGQSLARQRKLDEAEQVLAATAREHPNAAGPLVELAGARVHRQDFAGALELYRRAIAIEPWNASIHANAANMLSALDRHGEAIAEVEQAVRLDPEGARSWDAYATLLTRAGRTVDAQAAARRAASLGQVPKLRMSDVPAMSSTEAPSSHREGSDR
jgi:Tfp pilus assembly protein PilF